MVSPIPLELSLNFCSHKCLYCFANLNQPKRKANITGIMNFLSSYHDRKTLPALMLQQGYPVVVSNRVDPFAQSNVGQFLPILEIMTSMDIPVQIQTKGGKWDDIEAALEMMQPSVWYISIAHLNEDVRKRIEPGAPKLQDRLDLIDRLKARGHEVTVGINPIVPEWNPDPEPLIKEIKARGAHGVWIERLHFNYKQVAQLSAKERVNLGEDLIARSQKRRTNQADMEIFERARYLACENELAVFSNGQPDYSRYFDVYHRMYRTFPTMQDFINTCYEYDWTGKLIPFEVWRDILAPGFPEGTLPIDSYLGSTAHNMWWDKPIPPQMTYVELLDFIWGDHRVRTCPARNPCFAWAAQWDSTDPAGWIQYVDANGRPYLLFDPVGFDDYFAEAPDSPTIVSITYDEGD